MIEQPVVVGITGASGAVYAERMLQFLSKARIPAHVVVSRAGALVIEEELGKKIDSESPDVSVLGADPDIVKAYSIWDLAAPIASGTFPARGMVIIPASTGTLGAMASGIADNLIRRAGEVMLKEGRKLVIVLRETPLNLIHLESCVTLARAGATILPASPGFYHGVTELEDIVNFILTKTLDQLGIDSTLIRRWGQD
ncbi:MAG: flavin prenyltransferase UbiX [Planctomycetota bacterium]|jgi:4-hydroxy-3-polyprenylbenzoate decarboxylase|nr:flavin prenyltransferase UbiX [Planctomycetota bacterium]